MWIRSDHVSNKPPPFKTGGAGEGEGQCTLCVERPFWRGKNTSDVFSLVRMSLGWFQREQEACVVCCVVLCCVVCCVLLSCAVCPTTCVQSFFVPVLEQAESMRSVRHVRNPLFTGARLHVTNAKTSEGRRPLEHHQNRKPGDRVFREPWRAAPTTTRRDWRSVRQPSSCRLIWLRRFGVHLLAVFLCWPTSPQIRPRHRPILGLSELARQAQQKVSTFPCSVAWSVLEVS